MTKAKCTCSADPADPFAFSLAEEHARIAQCRVHGGEMCARTDKSHRVDWPRDITLIAPHRVGECARARAAADAALLRDYAQRMADAEASQEQENDDEADD